MAHIVPNHSKVDYSSFGPPIYKDILVPSSIRNFIPSGISSGTSGAKGTCRNELDNFLLSFLYDPFQ
jgi:hypothetical protein